MIIKLSNSEIARHIYRKLRDEGYDIRLGHVYEVISRMLGYDSWNHVIAAHIDFQDKMEDKTFDDIKAQVRKYRGES
jgi:hypothetical protein